MDLDHRKIALVIARGRAVNGLVLLVLPGIVGRLLFAKAGRQPTTRALLRLVGVRDLVLGIGAITTLKEHTMDAEWVGMGAVADAVDGLVSLLTPGLVRRSRFVALVGGGAAVAGLLASARDCRRPRRDLRSRFLTTGGSSRAAGDRLPPAVAVEGASGLDPSARPPCVREVGDRVVMTDGEAGHERGAA